MIKKTNPTEGKAKDLAIIAVICEPRNFQSNVAALEYADPNHKRFTMFHHVMNHEQVRGQRWDGYVKMWTSDNFSRQADNAITELKSRGVKELTIVRTANGPIVGLPNKPEVIS